MGRARTLFPRRAPVGDLARVPDPARNRRGLAVGVLEANGGGQMNPVRRGDRPACQLGYLDAGLDDRAGVRAADAAYESPTDMVRRSSPSTGFEGRRT
jgi:hypothetical protein